MNQLVQNILFECWNLSHTFKKEVAIVVISRNNWLFKECYDVFRKQKSVNYINKCFIIIHNDVTIRFIDESKIPTLKGLMIHGLVISEAISYDNMQQLQYQKSRTCWQEDRMSYLN